MNTYQKFSLSFVLALTLHLTILAFFGMSFSGESEIVKVQPVPEIIQASILDDVKIQQEAHRLKQKKEQQRLKRQKKQKELDKKLKKEQQRLRNAKKKRQQEEKKAKALAQKNKELARREKQQQKKLQKQRAMEAARKAEIKKQQDERAKKRKQQQLAEQKNQQEIVARQQAEAAQKQALLAKQQADERVRAEQNKQATISATAAIQQKVIDRWIKPVSSVKGMSCTVRVKLLASGDVMDAVVISSSGDSVFDRSAENAVRKASPLPVPASRALFAKYFREFTFRFKPEK